ncbi:hypothetical protein TMUPMC115_1055 [Tetragenococcus muriaticus PMC-11-5]|uniref:Uncharacterized protein n=2 Tax=Tetragenococcus muriaticus TaxID=64642 RepID=A0A091CD79_9ENTE|nr:hypothetical protein TMU3MR103_0946 [Tetragenococcus muriaticus 3MR10-3]KFN92243.1 hypothetical protein TMUPMC115_1055 [Tetragenococcus muriaticus PMC-11-5]
MNLRNLSYAFFENKSTTLFLLLLNIARDIKQKFDNQNKRWFNELNE